MVKNKDMQFFMENLKMKRKKDKKILTFRSGDLNSRFSVIFPPMISSWKVRSPRSNQNKLLKEIGLYCLGRTEKSPRDYSSIHLTNTKKRKTPVVKSAFVTILNLRCKPALVFLFHWNNQNNFCYKNQKGANSKLNRSSSGFRLGCHSGNHFTGAPCPSIFYWWPWTS